MFRNTRKKRGGNAPKKEGGAPTAPAQPQPASKDRPTTTKVSFVCHVMSHNLIVLHEFTALLSPCFILLTLNTSH